MSNSQKLISILCPMDSEARLLLEKLENPQTEKHGDIEFHLGNFNQTQVIVVKCGIGKVNAARVTQMLIDYYHPTVILNSGIAGGLADDLKIGDIIVGERLVQHDFDVSPLGYTRGCMIPSDTPDKPTYFSADKNFIDILLSAAQKYSGSHRIRLGCIASGDVFVSDCKFRKALSSQFGADVAEMEGAAVAQVATAANVPFLVLRAVSDLASGDTTSYVEFEAEIAALSAQVAMEFCKLA